MLKVVCTVVIVLSSGYRQVEDLEGVVLKDSGVRLLVDFGSNALPAMNHTAHWMKEKDCLYLQDPVLYYAEEQRIKQSFMDKWLLSLSESFRRVFHRKDEND